MRRIGIALVTLGLASAGVEAGLFHNKNEDPGRISPEVPPTPGVPRPLVAPNGVVVPPWASRRMENSPVPLFGKSTGRRPWAYPLSTQNTPSARWARADQLGFGAGPIPGFSNGPPLGNYPQADVGPGDGSIPFPRNRVPRIPRFPFNVGLPGY